MSPEQWNQAMELFHAACEKSGGERVALLDAASSRDPSLRLLVEQMLRDHEAECSFLDQSPQRFFVAPASARPAAGQRWGRYEIIAPLGRGGMGEVWAARDVELERQVAIKCLAPELGFGGAVEHLRREAKTISALNHPNIVTVHEVIRSESNVAIVMELVEGRSLRQSCKGDLGISQILDIGRQIARALAAAHARGIVHRDIKPENIIVRPDGCIKVLDFGLASSTRGMRDSSHAGLPAGTLRYMSPEQARGERATAASDIFSFALVLYEIATGEHAFAGASALETAHAILFGEPGSGLQTVSADFQRLVFSMLSKSPADRPQAEDVAHQLDEILGDIRGSSTGVVRGRRAFVRRWLWLALAAALVTIAAGWFEKSRNGNDAGFADLTIRPLTSQAGWETAPALSPDGNLVAFTWSARMDAPKQIYLKRLTDAEPVRLTDFRTGTLGYLAWSPDGRRIAFKRSFDQHGALYSIDDRGGDERKIVDLNDSNLSSAIDWSPDGTQVAFSDAAPAEPDQLAIYVYNLQTAEKHKLTSPPAKAWGDWNPKFSPDGRSIAFKRVTGFWADNMYLVASAGGPVQQITFARAGIWGHAWMPDGQSLLVSSQHNGAIFSIWRYPLKSPSNPERLAEGGADAITPATGRHTRRIVWVNQIWDLNIYRIAASGTGKPTRLIASTRRDQDAVYAPDGRIAWISDRSGAREIWIARGDGSSQTQVTRMNGPQIDHLRWSFDGRYLAFESRPSGYSDIFVVECPAGILRCGTPRALKVTPAESPGWSADSKSVYFSSNRTGKSQIWKQDLSGGEPTQITRSEGTWPSESADGKWLYFADRHDDSSIFRIPGSRAGRIPGSRGGPIPGSRAGDGLKNEQLVVGRPYKVQREGWTVAGGEIFFIDRPTSARPAAIRGFNPATGKARSILDLNEVFLDRGDISLSVSADGKSLLYAQLDRSGSNVIIAEKNH